MADGLFGTGRVAVVSPPAGYDLPLAPEQAVIVSTFKPDATAWLEQGYQVVPEVPEGVDHALVVLPRSKLLARGLIAAAASVPGTLAVDGQKTDGADSIHKDLRNKAELAGVITRDHGRLFWLDGGVDLQDWALAGPAPGPDGFVTQPGVFSADKVDPGSALLAAALPGKLPARVVDLGAGWGYLSRAILSRDGVEHVDIVEAERRALDCAEANVTDDRAAFHWADARMFRPSTPPGAVVMNPPFHETRSGAPDLGRAFIAAAAGMLTPSGHLWCVANRHLPYESALRERFREVEELPGSPAFKLFSATRPKRADRLG